MNPESAPDPAARSPFGLIVLLVAATLSQTGVSIIQQGIAVVAVFIRQELHLSLLQMGSLVSATSLGMMTGFMISGVLVDREGPRRMVGLGVGLTVLVVAALSLLAGYVPLMIGFFLLGVFASGVPTAGMRAIFGVSSPGERGLLMGIRQMGVPLGSAVAAALIPTLVLAFTLQGMWWLLGAFMAATGLFFFLAAPTWTARQNRPPFRQIIRQMTPALGPAAVSFFLVAGQYCTLGFTIVGLHGRLGWPLTLAGLGLAVAEAGGGVGRITLGWVSDRLAGGRPLAIGLAGLIGGLGSLFMGLGPRQAPDILVFGVLFFLGFGTVGWNSVLLTWVGERTPRPIAGQAMSWTASFIFLGSAIYPPLFGQVVDVTGHYAPAWEGLTAVLFAGTALAWALRRFSRVT